MDIKVPGCNTFSLKFSLVYSIVMPAENEMQNEAMSKQKNYLNLMRTIALKREIVGFSVTMQGFKIRCLK